MSLELAELAIAFAVVLVGAAVQGAVGFGLGLIAAPILLLIDPRFIPGPLIGGGVALTALVAWRERHDIHFEGLWPGMFGRFVGVGAAAAVLTVVSAEMFDLISADWCCWRSR